MMCAAPFSQHIALQSLSDILLILITAPLCRASGTASLLFICRTLRLRTRPGSVIRRRSQFLSYIMHRLETFLYVRAQAALRAFIWKRGLYISSRSSLRKACDAGTSSPR